MFEFKYRKSTKIFSILHTCLSKGESTDKKKPEALRVIAGSMFSGKTEELIRRLKRAKIARLKVEIFKPAIDTRYSVAEVVSS